MAGVRIRPKNRHVPVSSMCVVRDLARPFPPPANGRRLEDVQPKCSICAVQHFHKTYHLQLDGDGTVIVSPGIWAQLQTMVDAAGFEYVNHVEDPPAQRLALGEIELPPAVEVPAVEMRRSRMRRRFVPTLGGRRVR